jgi:uncharacterized protein (TIGR02284 family)
MSVENRLFLANVTTPERAFRGCVEGVISPRLKTVFEAAGRRCDEGAAELETDTEARRRTRSLGTVGGSLHRARTNIKSSITEMDERAVLAECERRDPWKQRAPQAIVPRGRTLTALFSSADRYLYGGRVVFAMELSSLLSVFVHAERLSEIPAPSIELGLNANTTTIVAIQHICHSLSLIERTWACRAQERRHG